MSYAFQGEEQLLNPTRNRDLLIGKWNYRHHTLLLSILQMLCVDNAQEKKVYQEEKVHICPCCSLSS